MPAPAVTATIGDSVSLSLCLCNVFRVLTTLLILTDSTPAGPRSVSYSQVVVSQRQ